MKRKLTFNVKVKKKGLFGIPYTATEKRTVEVDNKLYKKLKEQEKRSKELQRGIKNKPYSIEEMMFYDDLFGN